MMDLAGYISGNTLTNCEQDPNDPTIGYAPSYLLGSLLQSLGGSLFGMSEDDVNSALRTDAWMADSEIGCLKGCQNWRVVLMLYLFCWFIPAIFETLELIYVVHFPLREKRQYANIANHNKNFTDMSTGALDTDHY